MCDRYICHLLLAQPQLGTWPATQACALTGNQLCDLLVYGMMLQLTEPHWPGRIWKVLVYTGWGKSRFTVVCMENSTVINR